MKASLLILLVVSLSATCRGQDKAELSTYLQKHRYSITLSDANTFAMLPALMGNHNVLIHGENASHKLRLYDTLQVALRRQLIQQHLKVALIEYSHSMAYLFTQYLAGDIAVAAQFQPAGLIPYQPFKGNATFRVAGIDFEQSAPFYLAVKSALQGMDRSRLSESSAFIGMITDSSYANYSEKDFNTFYKRVSASFTAQDAALRKELGERYEPLKYLCTNSNVTKRYDNRNPALARNFMQEISPFDSGATYYCEIGIAHSRPNDKGSMAALLCKEAMLRERIIVMNTYCDNCNDGSGVLSNMNLGFMKGERLGSFRDAAIGAITLYDLSELTGNYEYMKESGTLLLFVRNHD